MRSDILRALLLALPIASLGACAGAGGKVASALGDDPSWGEANRQTMAAQIIDPAPQYDTAVPEGSGAHAAAAVERYRTDKIKQPEKITPGAIKSGGN